MEPVLLAIDCGTQSLRTILFSTSGAVLGSKKILYTPYISLQPGWAEQEPLVFWEALKQGCRQLEEESPTIFNNIAGIGVTTQRNSLVCLDSDGKPLRPVITWLDQRKAKAEYKPNLAMQSAYRIVGMADAIQQVQEDAACNWIRQNEPAIWKNTHKILQVSGYLHFRLTGSFLDSTASQIGHIPFNYKRATWEQVGLNNKLFPIPEEKRPGLIQPTEIIGRISPKASKETGLQEGIPVIACGSDKGCETVGMGVLTTDMASLSFGTTATVQTSSRRYFEPLRFMPAYPAPIPGIFNPEVEIFRGFWMITWFKEEFAHEEVLLAAQKGIAPEEVMNDLLKKSPPGALGLITQPFWSPGLKHPSAKGAMIGFGDAHKKEHVFRSVIEGLNFALKDGLHRIEKRGKLKVNQLAVSGGASQSDEICQISADIFGLPLVKGHTHETSALGAAIVTSIGLGFHKDFPTAVSNMVHYKKTFQPDPDLNRFYEKLFSEVYQKMFKSLSPLYNTLQMILKGL
jgi:sugar (pentulose or hexulose) kinase